MAVLVAAIQPRVGEDSQGFAQRRKGKEGAKGAFFACGADCPGLDGRDKPSPDGL
jgi:hypothetical protein